MLMKKEQLVLRRNIDMYLVNYGLNYQFWTFSILVVGIKFETKHC